MRWCKGGCVVATILVIAVALVSCSPTANSPSGTGGTPTPSFDAAAIEGTFSLLDDLGVASYLSSGSDGCLSFAYSRGEFVSDTTLPGCGWIHGRPPRAPRPFDAQSMADLVDLRSRFEEIGFPVLFLDLHRDGAGSISGISTVAADRCRE